MYLSPHVANLYSQIRSKALVQVLKWFSPVLSPAYRTVSQYFSPYVSADMTKMATAFNTTVAQLEDELTKLILDGQISARIDSHSKVKCLLLYSRFVLSLVSFVYCVCFRLFLLEMWMRGRRPLSVP